MINIIRESCCLTNSLYSTSNNILKAFYSDLLLRAICDANDEERLESRSKRSIVFNSGIKPYFYYANALYFYVSDLIINLLSTLILME